MVTAGLGPARPLLEPAHLGVRIMVDSVCRPSLLDAPAGDLVLRICGTSRDGQVVRLRSPKCVIGSGPGCTFRVLARGVRRAHCLIVRGPAAAVIRRWSPDTRLNGRAFLDAPLKAGDRLSVGPLELDVLETGSGSPCPPEPAHPASLSPPALTVPMDPASRNSLVSPVMIVRALEERLALANRQGHRRVRRLVERLRTARQELAESDTRRSQLDSRQAELDSRQSDLDALHVQLASRQSELAARERELAARQESLEALQTEMETLQAAMPGREEPPRAQPEEESGPSSDSAPVDTAAVIQQLGVHLPTGDAQESPSAGPVAGPAASSSDEESIDDYMSRLLQRVHSGSGAPNSCKPSAKIADTDAAESSGRPAATPLGAPAKEKGIAADSATERAARGPVFQGVQMPPARRAAAPQDPAELTALREVANVAAWTAIDRHGRRRLLRLSAAKLMVVLVALVCGGMMLWMWWFFRAGAVALSAGLTSLVVALVWGVQYAILTGKLVIKGPRHLQGNSQKLGPDVEPAPSAENDPGLQG